jgi:D-alanyl-D-alanine dipeptidase
MERGSVDGWRNVPVHECGEPLVALEQEGRVFLRPAYLELGYASASQVVHLRATAAWGLHLAASNLPSGFSLVVWDGWRPVELQAELYAQYRAEIAAETGLTGDALETATQKFVSLPSTDPAKPSPHLTGGAVDLTLGDRLGRPLEMGGDFDELSARTAPGFYEAAQDDTAEAVYRDRRRLLRGQMYGRLWDVDAFYGPALPQIDEPVGLNELEELVALW